MNIKHNQWKYTEVKEIFYLKSNCHLQLKSVVFHHHYVIFSRRSIKICQKFSFYIIKVNIYCEMKHFLLYDLLVQFSWVSESCPTLGDTMDGSTSSLPIHHQLLEFTQTHAYWVGDAIQQFHPLSSPSPATFNLSQHQGLF